MADLKYGKREPKRAPALQFGKYVRTEALANFPPVDYLAPVNWSSTMNGNDSAGDCVACGWANTRSLATRTLTGDTEYPTQAQVWEIYKTQNPNFNPNGNPETDGPGSPVDGGMDEQTLLEYLVKTGGPDGKKLVGFAQIDHTNLQELRNAISLGGTVMLGVQVAAVQQSQFPGVWDYDPSSPIEGGHCIIAGGHLDVAADDVKAVCWASEFGTTDSFLQHQLDEAWLLLWEEDLGKDRFIAGMDLATFASDFTAITGAQFPVPIAPAPGPAPEPPGPPAPPSPVPGDVDTAYFAANHAWALRKHSNRPGGNETAAENFLKWATEKGFPVAPHDPEHAA